MVKHCFCPESNFQRREQTRAFIMQPHYSDFKNQCPSWAAVLFMYNFMRQGLHKEARAEIVTPSSTDQQNKCLTAQICSAHVTSLKFLKTFHSLPVKIHTHGILELCSALPPMPQLWSFILLSITIHLTSCAEPLVSPQKPCHCMPLFTLFHLYGTSFSPPWPCIIILLIL